MRLPDSFEFIFIESSSVNEPSFPAEVYWGTIPSDEGASYVVNPQGVLRWQNWDADFFERHLITTADLQKYGTPPSEICDAISNDLTGKTIYAKDALRTKSLLAELFLAVERPICEITLENLDDLWLAKLATQSSDRAREWLETIKRRTTKENPGGGAFERLSYSTIWQEILESQRA